MGSLLLTFALGWLTTSGPVPVSPPPAFTAGAGCQDACYATKSSDYQRCRALSHANRPVRVACFQRADEALRRCLRSCR